MKEKLMALYKECFPEDNDLVVNYLFSHFLGEQNALYEYCKEDLASVLYLVDKVLYYKNSTLSMPYIVALGTKSEYRNKGFAKKLIECTLNVLNSCGVPFVALYPFKHSFYEKFGFITPSFDYTLEGEKVPCASLQAKEIYDNFCKGLDYYIVRDENYYKCQQDILGYDKEKFYLIQNGDKIIGYSTNDESIPYSFYDTKKKGTMLRIINVVAALKLSKLSFDKKIKLTDDLVPNNNFSFSITNGEITITDNYDITLDIKSLGDIIFGIKDLEGNKCRNLKGYLADKY